MSAQPPESVAPEATASREREATDRAAQARGQPVPAARVSVLVDGYFIDRPYGFGRYVRELVGALDRHAPAIDLGVLVARRGEVAARQLVQRSRILIAPERLFPVWEQFTVPRVARRQGFDLVHFPYQTSAWGWPPEATVMTVHDLIPFDPVTPDARAVDKIAHVYRRWVLSAWGRRAGMLVSVSPATRGALQARLGVDSLVVPNVVDTFVSMQGGQRAGPVAVPYFVHRGGVAAHKNTARVLAAFAAVREQEPAVHLFVFGLGEAGAHAASLPAPGVKVLERLDDAELARLYRGATGMVMPSLQEGFGLTMLEAFGFGVPVITSQRPPMSEIAANGAALLVDPESVGAIADAMLRIVREPALRTSLRAAAQQRMVAYSGAEVARVLERGYLAAAARLGGRAAGSAAR